MGCYSDHDPSLKIIVVDHCPANDDGLSCRQCFLSLDDVNICGCHRFHIIMTPNIIVVYHSPHYQDPWLDVRVIISIASYKNMHEKNPNSSKDDDDLTKLA